jgi:hypothetical protein
VSYTLMLRQRASSIKCVISSDSSVALVSARRFSGVPRLQDLASLELPAEDIEALSQCRPGDCAVKLSAAAMSRFRTQVNWSSPDAARQANEVAREMILELVRTYQAKGNEGLGHNDDISGPLDVAEQFRALLPADDLLPAPVPALIAHLEDYPRTGCPVLMSSSTGRSSTSASSRRSASTKSRFMRCVRIRLACRTRSRSSNWTQATT